MYEVFVLTIPKYGIIKEKGLSGAKRSKISRTTAKTGDMTLDEFKQQFVNAEVDEKRLTILSGLVEEAWCCKNELDELKETIKMMKTKGAKFNAIAKREKLLVQKRQSYTNMLGRICKETRKAVVETADFSEGLEDYE